MPILGIFLSLLTPAARAEDTDPRSMTRTEVQMLQEALTWAGNYYALKDGSWGRIAADAASEWRRQNGLSPSSGFSPGDLLLLLRQAAAERSAMRWTTYLDTATGVWIGYPGTLVRPQPSRVSSGGGTATDLRGEDGTLEITLFGPGLDLLALREMMSALARESQVEQVVYRLDREARQVQSANLLGGTVRYVRFDRDGNVWRGFAVKVASSRSDGGRLISAISGEFAASGRPVIENAADTPRLGPILNGAPIPASPAVSVSVPTIDVPPPRR